MKKLYVVMGQTFSMSAQPADTWMVAAYEYFEQASEHSQKLEEEAHKYWKENFEDGYDAFASRDWGKKSYYDADSARMMEGGNQYYVETVNLRQEIPL